MDEKLMTRYQEQLGQWQAEKAAFEHLHPNYCKTCEGWGIVGTGTMDRDTGFTDEEPCTACTENGKCPWCGADTIVGADEATSECSNPDCIWTENADGITQPPEDPAIYEW